jgi:flavin-binding protein dodecin
MGDNISRVYVVSELVGTSTVSWEDAAKRAIETAAKSVKDLRVGEVVKQDVTVEDGKIASYRVRLNVSFKFHREIAWYEEIRAAAESGLYIRGTPVLTWLAFHRNSALFEFLRRSSISGVTGGRGRSRTGQDRTERHTGRYLRRSGPKCGSSSGLMSGIRSHCLAYYLRLQEN